MLVIILIFGFHMLNGQSSARNVNSTNRIAAEWEPALGTLIAWPLSIPYKLVIELSKDNNIYTLVENQAAKHDAANWFNKWGIDTSQVKFIFAHQGIDVSWVRDWGPHAVFNSDGKMKLGNGKYIFATPVSDILCTDALGFLYKDGDKIIKTETDDNATIPLGNQIGIEVLDLPFISTGGNVMTDGCGTAFSSCILINENQFFGVNESSFFEFNKRLLGIEQYNILSNFEKRGIQHIDCFMKLLDEETIMVLQPPNDHELFPVYESIIDNELSKLKSIYGSPYKILRMKTFRYKFDYLAAYSNSLILNKTIYVPLFSIPEDSIAMNRWREIMPGYTVKGFEYVLKNEQALTTQIEKRYNQIGWNHGDALHCRTRAIWDHEMLYITVNAMDDVIFCNKNNKVYVTVIDYSKKGIIDGTINVQWRVQGSQKWHLLNMKSSSLENHFEAELPCQSVGTTIEYFVSASSNSGKSSSRPATAPYGFYKSSFKNER